MKYLPDTHILLWALKIARNSRHMPKKLSAIAIINCGLAASIWEVAMKLNSEKIKDNELVEPMLFYQTRLQENFKELTINGIHSSQVRHMTKIHKDPFDKILIT